MGKGRITTGRKMANLDPKIEFHMDLPKAGTNQLLYGHVLMRGASSDAGVKLKATSGSLGNQFFGSWTLKRRGPLPPSSVIRPVYYTVSTQRLWMPDVKGVEGSFYPISPFTINFGNVSRGDFGMHFDSNLPGSLACIVFPMQQHWDTYREIMRMWRQAGFQEVNLGVYYT